MVSEVDITISDQGKKDPPTNGAPGWICNDSVQYKSKLEDFGHEGETAVSTELEQLDS